MIKATVLTRQGSEQELYFNELADYESLLSHWVSTPNSVRLTHGWERSLKVCDITRVISVEEEN